ncbi:MAG: LamG domain-containing protein, partial [Rhodothermales bacterium]|nr:LamG domain-containing protein [Rhodothermales bacterium]
MNARFNRIRLIFALLLLVAVSHTSLGQDVAADGQAVQAVQSVVIEEEGQNLFEINEATTEEVTAARSASQSASVSSSAQAPSISASDGTSDYKISASYSAKQACVFADNLKITLQAINSAGTAEFSRTINSGVGYLGTYSGTWTVYPGPSKSYTFKITARGTGGLNCDYTESKTNGGSTRSLRPPTNVTASANGSDQNVTVKWSRGSNITDDRVLYHAIYKNGSLLSYRPYGQTSYTVASTPESTDEYGVATYFSGYTITPSRFSTRVNRNATTAAFKSPTSIVATDGTTVRSIDLSWSNPSDYASATRVYRDGEQIASLSSSATSFSDSEIIPGQPYDYCLENSRSSALSPQGCAPDPGRSFFITADDGTKSNNVRLDWTLNPFGSTVTNIQILRNGQEVDVKSSGSTTFTDLLAEPGVINKYDVVLRDASNNTVIADYDFGFIPADGEIKGAVTSEGLSSGGVRDVLISAQPDGDAFKYSLKLNGVDNYLKMDHRPSLSLGQSYTVELWVKPSQIREQTILAKGTSPSAGPFGFAMNADGTVSYHARSSSTTVSSNSALAVGQWTHVAVVQDERINQVRLFINGTKEATAALEGTDTANSIPMTIGANSTGSSPFAGGIDEFRIWNVAREDSAIVRDMSNIVDGGLDGLTSYWRFSAGSGETAGDIAIGGGNHGALQGDVEWSTDQADLSHRTVTDNRGQGEFSLTGLPYAPTSSGTLYSVVPTKDNHAFDPAERFERLTESSHIIDDSNFTDTTSVSVAGQILFEGTSCPVDSVEIRIDDIPSGLTEDGGFFAVGGIERGQHTVLPVYREHSFSPASSTINFTGDVSGLTFLNTTKRTLSGFVAGGQCKAEIGRARITVTAPNGCFTQAVVTSDQQYSLELPAQNYLVSVEMLDDPTINFASREIDLTDADSLMDFIYYAPPEVVITGFPSTSCANPILEQARTYEVLATVTERYGSQTCEATIGEVEVFDEISDNVTPATVALDETGVVRYDMTAGAPNIVSGGPTPFQKRISFAASTPGGDVTADELVIVEGNRPREQTFTTVSPQIPLLILRDPPGDQSYSYKQESVSSCYAASLSLLADASVGVFNKVRAGTKFELEVFGVSFETKVWGELSSSLEVGARTLSQTEREICVNSTNTYSTSGNQDVTGAEGDVFVGSALNIVYAITDVLDVEESANACPVSVTQEIIYDNDGFATQYHYTESHIRNSVIPDLEINRELASTATKKQEFEDQIDVWQQTLDLNERLKRNAIAMGDDFNLSFSANAPLEQSTEWTVTNREKIEFNLYLNSETAAEAGVEIGGVGASGGVRVRASLDVGESQTATTTTTNKTGFFLADDDGGDAFTVDVLRDDVYGTPVFNLISGVSSSPHEPNTLPRDGVQLSLTPATQTLADANAEAEVILSLGNTGQNFESREYELAFLQESNPFGAEVSIGGSQVQGPIPYTLADSESRQVTLCLKRSAASSVYDYDDLQV